MFWENCERELHVFVSIEGRTVEAPRPVFGELVCILEGVGEVVGVVFMDVFDTKFIYYKGECNGASDMSPQAGRVGDFKISVGGEVFLEGRVSEDACLR